MDGKDNQHQTKPRILYKLGQLVAKETAKRRELQDAQVEEGLKQHEAGGDYDDGEMVMQQKRLSGAAVTAKKKKDQLMKKLHKKGSTNEETTQERE
jgi:hypothetical protein